MIGDRKTEGQQEAREPLLRRDPMTATRYLQEALSGGPGEASDHCRVLFGKFGVLGLGGDR